MTIPRSIDGRPSGEQFAMNPRQVEGASDLANEVVGGNHLLKVKTIKELTLVAVEPPHIARPQDASRHDDRIIVDAQAQRDFCNKIGTFQT
jgi:hypothetical protein